MKKLNITKEHFEKSKYFTKKYGKLEYVSESGKLFKTDKGHVIKFVKESDESNDGSAWFDDRGELVKPLPGQCIEDCSGNGRVDDEVAYWVNALKFDLGLPRERAINFLSEYGAWELDELDGMDDFNLAEKVLWIFCGNIKEEAYQQSEDETSLVYDWGDVSDWDDEDWKKFQEEYSYCSLNS